MTCERCSVRPKRDPLLVYCEPCAEAALASSAWMLRAVNTLNGWTLTPLERSRLRQERRVALANTSRSSRG